MITETEYSRVMVSEADQQKDLLCHICPALPRVPGKSLTMKVTGKVGDEGQEAVICTSRWEQKVLAGGSREPVSCPMKVCRKCSGTMEGYE